MANKYKRLITTCPQCGGKIDHRSDRGCPRIFCDNKCKQANKNSRNRLTNLYKEITLSWRNTFIQLEKIRDMTLCNICLSSTDNTVKDGKLDVCIECLPKIQALRKK